MRWRYAYASYDSMRRRVGRVILSADFTTKYQDLQDAPYIPQAAQEFTLSHYFIETFHSFQEIYNYKYQTIRAFLDACNNFIIQSTRAEISSTSPAPGPAPGQYVFYISSYIGHTLAIVIEIPGKSYGKTPHRICDTYGHIYTTTTRFLIEPTQDELHRCYQHTYPCHIHIRKYLPDMPAEEPISVPTCTPSKFTSGDPSSLTKIFPPVIKSDKPNSIPDSEPSTQPGDAPSKISSPLPHENTSQEPLSVTTSDTSAYPSQETQSFSSPIPLQKP